MNIHVFENIDDPFLKSEWERLETEADVFPQMYYEWCEPWWRLRSGNRKLHIVTVIEGKDKIVVIAPLCIEKRFGLRILRSFPIHFVDFYSFLYEDGESSRQILKLLIEHLTAYTDWDVVHLYNVNDRTLFWTELRDNGFSSNLLCQIRVADFTGMNYEEYLRTLSHNSRKLYRKKLKRINLNSSVRLERFEDSSDYLVKVRIMKSMYNQRWSDDFTQPPDDDHYIMRNEAVINMFKKRKMILYLLRNSDDLISFRLGFLHDDTFWDWKVSHNQKYEEFSPGMLIIGLIIEDLISRDLKKLNFMAGDYQYKRSWSTPEASSGNYELFASRRNIMAYLYVRYRLRWRSRLRLLYYTLLKVSWVRAINRRVRSR